jgi:16S rRNA processing protein RimM
MVLILEVGRILRPHGLRGDVVVEFWTNRPERWERGSRLFVGRESLEVARARPLGGDRWVVGFVGVSSRDQAEQLRDLVLRAEEISDPDALWVHRLIGSAVQDRSGRDLGVVVAVEANPASDLLVLEGGGLVPARFVVEAGEGRVVVEVPAGLLDEGPFD